MPEKKIKWTEQQERAIGEHRRDVLVTASAGTGKTAVLSGSCVNVVSNRDICSDVSGVLVLTFTDMAAEQMQSRIAAQLHEAWRQARDSAVRDHLKQQLILLAGADVSTIHSFCKRLITEYFHKLELDPGFGIVDADESRLLKAEALERTIDWAWEREQADLAEAMQQLLGGRDLRTGDGFLSAVIEISDFLDGVVSRGGWRERAARLAEAVNPFATDLGAAQKEIIARRLGDAVARLRYARAIYRAVEPDGDWDEGYEQRYIRPVLECLEPLNSGNWQRCSRAILQFNKPRISKPELAEWLKNLIHGTIKAALDSVEGLQRLAVLNPDYLERLSGAVSGQSRLLIRLVERFDDFYSRAKRDINCLDFADLEHYAIRLLSDGAADSDNLCPSETALELRQRYRFIFVDEYQDINAVQKAILDMLSGGGNVFAVGDVKQSIYAWRGARPEIFLDQLRGASAEPKDDAVGLRVDLNANFRSRPAILDFVNAVFGRIMTASLAGLDYDQAVRLAPAPRQGPQPGAGRAEPCVEMHILDEAAGSRRRSSEEDESDVENTADLFSSRRREAALVAQRIKRMVGAETGRPEFKVFDKTADDYRDVRYADIVILMRSLANKTDFVEVLRLAQIPVSCQAIAGYFEATEIVDMLSLLKVLDNPQQDIALAAVLRSPMFNVTDTELAAICLHAGANHNKDFYDCLCSYRDADPDNSLAGRLAEILAQIDGWRTFARRGNLADLIWAVYRQTGFLSFVSALPNGRARKANLLKLHERAIQFEGFASSAPVASLARFTMFVEKIVELGRDWSPAETPASAGNAVRVLSVHKSKGLEFPVVFIADLNSRFSTKGTRADVLFDERFGLGLRTIDEWANAKLDSLAYQVIAEETKMDSLAEEMRILYVAMTRAAQRLVLVGSESQNICRKLVTSTLPLCDEPIPDWMLRSAKSHLQWILYALADRRQLHKLFGSELEAQSKEDNLFDAKLYDQSELERLSAYIRALRAGKSKLVYKPERKTVSKQKSQLLQQVKNSLSWRYGFGDAPILPAKRSVTQWTHRNDEFTELDFSRALERRPAAVLSDELPSRPDARLIGIATHLVMSKLDLDVPVTQTAVEQVIADLVAADAITQNIASRINRNAIVSFFETDIGHTAVDKKNKTLCEWPFTFAVPASQWKLADEKLTVDVREDETIIIQGIIDMLIERPDGLIVVDFKTDMVGAEQIADRAKLYEQQLWLYAEAAAAILDRKILSNWLYFLAPASLYKV